MGGESETEVKIPESRSWPFSRHTVTAVAAGLGRFSRKAESKRPSMTRWHSAELEAPPINVEIVRSSRRPTSLIWNGRPPGGSAPETGTGCGRVLKHMFY